MLFNSFIFALFLPIVFGIYWSLCYPKPGEAVAHWRVWVQNLFVVVASYVFYGWWDWRFLLLISFTSLWAYFSGKALRKLPERGRGAKWVVALALIVNVGILGVFKYYDFFQEQAVALLQVLGFQAHPTSLQILLPVGISFYTFQAMSYVLDVYRRQLEPTRNMMAFLAFVSFFPQLVAGPIERATNLLPQFQRPRTFDYALAVEGCRQMLWGFMKKLLIADTCAFAANTLLGYSEPSSLSIWAGMCFFAFQIYGDFSGYSDIAIGCSKLFGIRLMRNFNHPYFARDIAEFWRRWHISLTTWFRDYLYIPLGGSRCGTWKKIRNTFAIFLVSGLWHGANWTFIAWGAFHAVCFLPLLLAGKNRTYAGAVVAEGRHAPTLREVRQMVLTFVLVVIGWTFFRAPDIATAFEWLTKMLLPIDLRAPEELGFNKNALEVFILVVVFLVIEWFNRTRDLPLLPKKTVWRWTVYCLAVMAMIEFLAPAATFIYFQF